MIHDIKQGVIPNFKLCIEAFEKGNPRKAGFL